MSLKLETYQYVTEIFHILHELKVYFRSVYYVMKSVSGFLLSISFKAVLSTQGHERVKIFINKRNVFN